VFVFLGLVCTHKFISGLWVHRSGLWIRVQCLDLTGGVVGYFASPLCCVLSVLCCCVGVVRDFVLFVMSPLVMSMLLLLCWIYSRCS